jgi:hypothetical protein
LSATVIGGDVLFHYNPLQFASIFQLVVLHHFFAKVWAISHGNLLGHMSGSESYPSPIGNGLMDPNKSQIGNVDSMSLGFCPNIMSAW